MVVSASLSSTGAMKRPSSSLQEDCNSWEAPPSMAMPMRPSFNLPYSHYAMIYMDNMGKLKVSESPSIREQHATIFTPEVREKFLEILGSKIGYHKPMIRRFSGASSPAYGYGHQEDFSRQVKRRKSSIYDHGLDMHYSSHYSEPVEDLPQYPATNMVGLEIGDSEKVFEYYENALKHFQQLNCRQIAKAFIKFIEPRKQVKHPYNGGKPRAGAASGEKGDPEKTKPEWWPAGVVHKEPDHLRKEQRIRLLIHIIRKLGRFNITPDKLQEVAYDSKRQLRPTSKIEVLDEVFKVRRMEERYERGEIDATTLVYVVNRDANTKGDKDSDSISEADQKVEADEVDEAEEGFMTPASTAQPTTSSFAPVDLTLSGHSRSMHMGGDREQLFPLPESLSFEEAPRPERSYYQNTSEYSDEYSHGMMKPPVTSAMVNSSEPGSFDYLTQAPFPPASTSEMVAQRPAAMPMQHSVSHFDSWTPSFRPNVFNPMDYGNSANQTLSQPPLSYQLPITSPSHGSEIPHGLPDPMSHKGGPFHPNPLGHSSMATPHHATTA